MGSVIHSFHLSHIHAFSSVYTTIQGHKHSRIRILESLKGRSKWYRKRFVVCDQLTGNIEVWKSALSPEVISKCKPSTAGTHEDWTPWNRSSGFSSSSVKDLGFRIPSSCDLGGLWGSCLRDNLEKFLTSGMLLVASDLRASQRWSRRGCPCPCCTEEVNSEMWTIEEAYVTGRWLWSCAKKEQFRTINQICLLSVNPVQLSMHSTITTQRQSWIYAKNYP